MYKNDVVQWVECPRDAMQGWPVMISTQDKIAYLRELLKVGFHTLDFGSFVSSKAIPQLADTQEVLDELDLSNTSTKLLAIIANARGAEQALQSDKISYLGFPFSVSETFQQRNTNSSRDESLERVKVIQQLCVDAQKELVIYLSMGFGNPYGDPYTQQIVTDWGKRIADLGISTIAVADTVGLATTEQVSAVVKALIENLQECSIGVHLHAPSGQWQPKIQAALEAGCRRIDGALKGIGGCPMAGNDLVGNVPTEEIVTYLETENLISPLNKAALSNALVLAQRIFH